ncbi:MAG: serine/threonine-protein kinase, partial [Proteobacteria bacterium]|nr:serine/threonine-protein kinase [Pseudomonadota bacterium]
MANDSDDSRTGAYADSDAPTTSGPMRGPHRAATVPLPDERYRILEKLGQGGMGEIMAAHDNVLGREVAIKRMRSDSPSALHISRFLREAQIQARLDHPTIPPVHELAHDERGLPYFVMKRLTGMTLGKILEQLALGDPDIVARFTRQALLRAFVDVCMAIERAHSRGILHRDIKPSNIMLGDFGEVFVLDWGIAKIIGDIDPWSEATNDPPSAERDVTAPGTVIGTLRYMSPERRRGAEVDASADIYALGCLLFEILTYERVPRDGANEALRPSDEDPNVSPELDRLCARATAPLPRDRVASARELGVITQRFLDGDSDLELRKRLADDHYRQGARAALERDIDEDQQRLAIQ